MTQSQENHITATIDRPILDLSGPRLTAALQTLIDGSEAHGGIERYVEAVNLKTTLFQEALRDRDPAQLDLETFKGLCTFMSTVRRRVGAYLDEASFDTMHTAIVELLVDVRNTASTDARISAFCARFPQDKRHRWVRDLAAEILHNTEPERYPLMSRWVWDAGSNSGVIREIWHGDDVDHITIPVADGYPTFIMLREELSQFLTQNGLFDSILLYVDLLCAQVYAGYICEQGSTFLRADFSTAEDPLGHTRRLLGLDGVKPGSGRTRLKTGGDEVFIIDDSQLLN